MSLNLIIGPMRSGKTTKALEIIRTSLRTSVFAINHSLDTRYGTNQIISHDKDSYPCHQTDTLMDVTTLTNYTNSEIVVIDEAHFFGDLVPFVNHSLSREKKLYVVGLNGDYRMKPIGNIIDLIPMCDTILKLSGICDICGMDAPFTKRLVTDDYQILVGDKQYSTVCRKHFN